jgi:hypothetical protein
VSATESQSRSTLGDRPPWWTYTADIGTVHLVTLQRSTEPAERCVHRGRSRKRVSDLQPGTRPSGWSSGGCRYKYQYRCRCTVQSSTPSQLAMSNMQLPSTRGAELTTVDGAGSEAANITRRRKCQSGPQLSSLTWIPTWCSVSVPSSCNLLRTTTESDGVLN